MREELEGLINEKLNDINTSLEDMYTPYDEEIKQEIEYQNKKMEQVELKKTTEEVEENKENEDAE